MTRFSGKVTLITGGGGGLGRASALRFAEEKASVAIADVDLERAQAGAAEIGSKANAIRADVTSIEDCEAMVKTARDSFGRLDIILANAGVGGERVEFVDLPIDEWDRVIGVSLRGLAHTCKAAAPALIDAGGGLMALMGSSTGGWDTILGSGPQMTSQEAIKAVARDLALELARYRIRDNAVCPSSSKQH